MKKKPKHKALQVKAGNLWKEACWARDGKRCMVQVNFPHIKINHTDVYQVDHFISRANKWYFFNASNGTAVCSACNMMKHHHAKSVHKLIEQIVVNREGEEWVKQAYHDDHTKEPNPDFNKVWWLEGVIEILRKQIEEFNFPQPTVRRRV